MEGYCYPRIAAAMDTGTANKTRSSVKAYIMRRLVTLSTSP